MSEFMFSNLSIFILLMIGTIIFLGFGLPYILKKTRNNVPVAKEFQGEIVDKVTTRRITQKGKDMQTTIHHDYLIMYQDNMKIYTYHTSLSGNFAKKYNIGDECIIYLNVKDKWYSSID